ncbi:serine protease snake [Helicoverpa armigera]|uniref:serine protease snake n=1 Tax=Helicoverpa armigera TaxID=29058 RepID=UPI003083A23D
MYKYIALCVCVCLGGVAAHLNKEEGAPCEWDGVRGQCVKETRCFTTLARRGADHPVCSTKDNVKIVCCTDCHLINDTRNVVMTLSGYAFKDGTKARDNCLEYLKTLPHHCREEGSYSGVSKSYDEQHKCHTVGIWGIGGSPIGGYIPGAEYPHQALLGYGTELSSAQWTAGGTIISERYILTAAHCSRSYNYRGGPLTFVALDVKRRSDPPYSWQTNRVKRFIPYPEYKVPSTYHDIALIETETSIIFNKNVLPACSLFACLHVEDVNTGTAKALTWRDVTGTDYYQIADTIQTINLEKFTYEECNKTYQTNRRLKNGIDSNTQMCYGSRSQAPEACMGLSGEPLLVSNQFSDCIHTVIGVTSFGARCGRGYPSYPDVFIRVAYYKTWIESIVWA